MSAGNSQVTIQGATTVVADGTSGAQIRVVAKDQYDNPMAGAAVTWLQLPAKVQNLFTDTNGVADFTVTSTTAGNQKVEIYINGVKVTQTVTVAFVAGPPAHLRYAVQPSASQSGQVIAPAVQVSLEDANNNVCLTSTAAVTLAVGQGNGSLIGTLTVNAVSGVARFDNVAVDLAGASYTLVASSPQLAPLASAAFDVTSSGGGGGGGASTDMAMQVEPSNTVAGQVIAPAVQVKLLKANGSVDTGSTASVTIALSSNPANDTLGGTLTVSAVAGVATFSDLVLTKSAAGCRLRASAAGLAPVTSTAFDIAPAAPAGLRYAVQPSSVAAGAAIAPSVQVTVVDAYDNLCASDTSAVTLSLALNPGSATLGGTKTVNAVGGVAVFADLTLDKTAVDYALNAAAAGLPSAVSSKFDVTAGPPSHLKFTVQPTQGVAGQTLSTIQVSLLDPLGNVRTTANDHVTLALGPNPPAAATLSGTLDVAAVNGVATFDALTLDKSGQGYTLAATASGYGGDTSAAFDVVAGAPSVLAITAAPQSGVAGQTLSAVQVTLRDDQGNTINSTANVMLVVDQGPALLKGATTKAAVAGVATFDAVYVEKSGTYTLSATSSGYAGATPTSPFVVIHGAAAKLTFTTQPSTPVAARQALGDVAVTVYDAFDNVIDDSAATIDIALGTDPSGGTATLAGTLSHSASAGVATFSNLSLNKAFQGYTLKASATLGATPVQTPSSAFDVTAGTAAKLRFVTQPPASVDTGVVIVPSVTVAVEDADGNRCTTSTANVALTLSGQNPSFPATLGGTPSRNAVAGLATFDDLTVDIVKSGYGLDAASSGLTSASSSGFAVAFGSGPITWYVSNTAAPGGTGQQAAPFNTLADAGTAAHSGDTILVMQGDGTTNNQNGIALADGVTLEGQGAALIGPVSLGSSCTVKTIAITNPGGPAIQASGKSAVSLTSVTVRDASVALSLGSMTGNVTVSGFTATSGVSGGVSVTNSQDATLSFSNLTITSTAGPALLVNNASAGTGSIRCTGTNTVSATSGAALDLLRVALPSSLAFDQLSSASSTTVGIRLENLTGPGGVSVSTGVTVTDPAESGILVKNCGTGHTFDFGAASLTGTGSPAVIGYGVDGVTGNNGSTFKFARLDVTTDRGAALFLGASSLDVGDGIVAANLAPALDLSGTSITACTLSSVTSTNSATTGVRLDNLVGAGTVWMKGGNLSAPAADLSVTGGTASVTFDGPINNTGGPSVSVSGRLAGAGLVKVTGQVSDLSGAQDRGIVFSSNAGGTLAFTNTVTIDMTTGAPILLNGNTGGTLQFQGNLAATTTSGTTVSSTSSSASLDIAGGGTITASGAGTAFNVSGASAPVITCNATLKSVNGRVASIQNATGGSVTLSGTLDGNDATGLGLLVNACSGGTVTFSGAAKSFTCGTNQAVTLTSNTGATIRFTNGGLTLQTTNGAALTASGGGTIEVQGAGNTITTTTGAAINIANTSIGANGLSFASINTNGATTAITLNNTGSASGLTVTGAGTTTADASGGTLQNVGTALDLTSTAKVRLHQVDIKNTSGPGVRGTNVTDLRLEYVRLTNCGDNNGGSAPYDQAVTLTNLRGTNSAFDHCTFTASALAERLVYIDNNTGNGTPDLLTVDTCTLSGTLSSPVGADLFEFTAEGINGSAGNLRVDFSGGTLTNAATNAIQQIAQISGRSTLNVSSAYISNVGSCVDMAATDNAILTFNVHDNPTMYSYGGLGTNVVSLFTGGSATATGHVNNNPDMRGGGAGKSGNGIRFDVNDTSTAIVEAKSNTVSAIGLDIGIDARARTLNAWLQATLTGNSVTVLATALYDMRVEAGGATADTAKVTAFIANNICSGAGSTAKACFTRTRNASNVIQLQGFTTDATTTWNANNNTPAGAITVVNNGTIQAGTPTTPP